MLQKLFHTRLILNKDGTPFSDIYQDIYHSAQGALNQSKHVFIKGNQLPRRWQNEPSHTILELGFGLGCNFLMTCKTWKDDPLRCQTLQYLAFEKNPLLINDLKKSLFSLKNYHEIETFAQALFEQWPLPLNGIYTLTFESGKITLTLVLGDALEYLPKISARVQSFYLDGFSPKKNPDLWSNTLFKQLAKYADENAHCATYTTAKTVHTALQKAGFLIQKQKGFGLKKEMTTGKFHPPWKIRKYSPPFPFISTRQTKKALIVGGGIAGCATAYQLAQKNWDVHLYEQNSQIAEQGSSNPSGISHPILSKDNNILSKLTTMGFFYALNQFKILEKMGFDLKRSQSGLLQLIDHPALEAYIKTLPKAFAQIIPTNKIKNICGVALKQKGVYFPEAGSIHPQLLCKALTQAYLDNTHLHFNQHIDRIEYIDQEWHIFNQQQLIDHAPILILANAHHAQHLIQSKYLQTQSIRGQISFVPNTSNLALTCPIIGQGYCIPLTQQTLLIGATYDLNTNKEVSIDSHFENIQHFKNLIGNSMPISLQQLKGKVGFRCTTIDHLPIVGQIADEKTILSNLSLYKKSIQSKLPRLKGLYGNFAYGSRGLTWGQLAAAIICSDIEGYPMPIEKQALLGVDPARFIFKHLQKS